MDKQKIGGIEKEVVHFLPKKIQEITMPNSAKALPQMRHCISSFLEENNIGNEQASELLLCVDEAIANAIRYGQSLEPDNNTITLRWAKENNKIIFELTDHGYGFAPDLENWQPPKADAEKGRGIFIMKNLLSDLKYEDTGRGTKVTLIKELQKS